MPLRRRLYLIQVRLIAFLEDWILLDSCPFSFVDFEAGSIGECCGRNSKGVLLPAGTFFRIELIKSREEIKKPVSNKSFILWKNLREEVLCEG